MTIEQSWTEEYKTYAVKDSESQARIIASPMGVSVLNENTSVFFDHETFKDMALSILKHNSDKGFIQVSG